jgi:hypothetical protein
MTALVSFLCWTSLDTEADQSWLVGFKNICNMNRRDRDCEILVSIRETHAFLESKIHDMIELLRGRSPNPEEKHTLDPLFCDASNIRTFIVPKSNDILAQLNFLGCKSRGRIIHPVDCELGTGMLTGPIAARDIRIVFERHPSKLGSVSHFWEGNNDFCSFSWSKNVFLGAGGFHFHDLPDLDNSCLSETVKFGIASVQMCQLYDNYLEHVLRKTKKERKNVFIVSRSCPQSHYEAFHGLVLTDTLFPIKIPEALEDSKENLLLKKLLSNPVIRVNSQSILPILTMQTSHLRSQIETVYKAVSERKMIVPHNACETVIPQASQRSIWPALPNRQSNGGNIIGFSWWNKKREEREHEQIRQTAIRHLANLRRGCEISKDADATEPSDGLSTWEVWSIVFAVVIILLMILSISLSIIAITRSANR